MTLSLCSFASGSSGNCYLVKTENTAVLIDAGLSSKTILRELDRSETARENVVGVFVTHEHWDHTTGLRVLLKRLSAAKIFASGGTIAELDRKADGGRFSFASEIAKDRRSVLFVDGDVRVGDMTVQAFSISHDAREPLAFTVRAQGKEIAIVTDTGIITDDILYRISDADILVLESNHDVDMLRNGTYPAILKRRILGEEGHLSNAQASRALVRLFEINPKRRVVLLAHLSSENNEPIIAEQTVLTALAQVGIYTGKDLYLGVLLRDTASLLYSA